MIQGFSGEDVVIVRRSYEDSYDDYGLQKETKQFINSQATLGYRTTNKTNDIVQQVLESDLRLFFPNGTVILPDDLFIIRGTLWETDGASIQPDPQAFRTPLIFAMPVVVNIKQSAGNVIPPVEETQEEEEEELEDV